MSRLPPESAGALPDPADADRPWQPTERLPHRGAAHGHALPPGIHLAEFELLRVLGEGGFGIVYLAHDHALQRRVAIKEYMPASLALRAAGEQVVVSAERHRAVFDAGLDSFINEARLLAQFDHPSLVKVYRVWRANGTAYMVMPYYEGRTLKQHLRDAATPPDERWLRALLAALTDALAVVHGAHCLHRDIAPDNILLLAGSDRPLLLDFGAARQVIGDATQALTAILKPGYAPIEQYAENPALRQGPWTDIYALCAVVHAAVTGRMPPPAVGRTVADRCVPLAQAAAGRYDPAFLQAIDAGLRVLPGDRPASIQAFRQLLGLDGAAPAPPAAPARPTGSARRRWAGAGALALALGIAGAAFWAGRQSPGTPGNQADAAAGAAPAATVSAAASTATAPRTSATAGALPAPAAAWSTAAEFQRLLEGRSEGFDVRASADAPRLRIGRDRLGFRVSAARDGHVYVLLGSPDGTLLLLFPNRMSTDNRIRAGQTLILPQPSWQLDTTEPAGTEQFAVIVSEHPRDFGHLGQAQGAWFLQLASGTTGAALARAHAGPGSVVAGQARCSGAGCDRYGAALFSIEVVH